MLSETASPLNPLITLLNMILKIDDKYFRISKSAAVPSGFYK